MQSTTQRRRRYERREIDRWLSEQDHGCLSYRELSRRSGIPIPTLAGWRRRARIAVGSEESGFVELSVGEERAANGAGERPVIEVTLTNGRRIAVQGSMEDARFIARLATLLESPC